MNNPVLVSILINNYNYGRFLRRAIDSALAQTYPCIEVIVVDDGSTDNSRDIIAGYGNRIIPILKENAGQASAFNAGFGVSQGEIICFLDSDDFFNPEKVTKIVDIFDQNPYAGWLFHDLYHVNEEGQPIPLPWGKSVPETELVDVRQDLVWGKVLRPGRPATSGLCFKRSTLTKILPMPEGPSVSISDEFIKVAAHYLAPGLYCPEYLAAQRLHQSNIYTFSEHMGSLRSVIGVKTAYYLRERFPEIAAYTDKVFASSFGTLLGQWGLKRAINFHEARQYVKRHFPIHAWFLYAPRIAFNYIKRFIKKS
ncbi:MAG: glycosyltransferase [Deltaproteobacteria bacterium]|nr:glycosyltransferase [Deltaproteobacteria bacterium]